KIFNPIMESHSRKLEIKTYWSDDTVNAYASQDDTTWHVVLFGGLARRPEVTLDGFALVICHELGHHLAGYVFYTGESLSAEGQPDYFATHSCAAKVWRELAATPSPSLEPVPGSIKDNCNHVWSTQQQQQDCYRTVQASMGLARLLAKLGSQPLDFNVTDTSV